jgi:hypothetical protein
MSDADSYCPYWQDWLCEVTHPGEPCPADSEDDDEDAEDRFAGEGGN